MPQLFRLPVRMDCPVGVDLTHPLDKMPQGAFAYLFNVRILQEGRFDGRPGYLPILNCANGDIPNSIRRLNDSAMLYAEHGHIYLGGAGSKLYAGVESLSYASIDTGYSGHPLSLIPFRPDQSPESWMYVYDQNKQVKVRPDQVIRAIGIAPPTRAPSIEYGVPASVDVSTGQSATSWAASGAASAPTLTDRTQASGVYSIDNILYNSGSTGWACVNPNTTGSESFWMGERMGIVLNTGQPTVETVIVREIHNAIEATTIAAIQYDSGSTGLCSIVLTANEQGLARNSLLKLNGAEVVRVLQVILSPDGTTYSIRCNTVGTFVAGNTAVGLLSWYVYTTKTHAAAETIVSQYIAVTQSAAGVGILSLTSNINASQANGRPIDAANDYLHLSVFIANPSAVVNLQILLSLDSAVNLSFSNPGNSYTWTVTPDQLYGDGSSSGAWAELILPTASASRTGVDLTRNLSTISGIALQLTSNAACNWGFDWWYLFGTYGPTILPNAPTGYEYQARYRDSSTGAHSVPGPLTRYQLFPLRESVIITPGTSAQAGVDQIDLYRFGGTISSPLYVGSAENIVGNAQTLLDTLPDDAVLIINKPPDLAAMQPWPLLVTPWIGECKVVGTSLAWQSGHAFDLNLLSNSVVLINGVAFQTYGQPRSNHTIELTQSAGYLASANFEIAAPTLAAQPLPFAFGALEGPFAPVILALGDPLNGGTLYYSNFSDADSASDQNTIELAPPGADLVSGAVWNGMAFAGNQEDLFCIRFSYLTQIGASNSNSFQWVRVNTPSGIWSRWACCDCPLGVAYLGRDGIYIASDTQGVNITDKTLYPLFPHDGQPAKAITLGDQVILPVDMTQTDYLRLTYCDQTLRFSYRDIGGNFVTLVYGIPAKRWLMDTFADGIGMHYMVEGVPGAPTQPEILMLNFTTDTIVQAGGNTDNGAPINSLVLVPSIDGGDERSQKLYVDSMVMVGGTGTIEIAHTYDSAQVYSPITNLVVAGKIKQFQVNISSQQDLTLYLNIGAKFAWTGGPDGPQLYAWEPIGYTQPYLTQRSVTQQITFSFPGWKHVRRLYPAYISNSDLAFTLITQDGRVFGPYTLLSSQGKFRIFPQMLDHGIKDMAFSLQLDGNGQPFAYFPDDFTLEVKEWVEETYIKLAVFKS